MSQVRIAANYANALLAAAKDKTQAVEQLAAVVEAFNQSAELRAVLQAPVVSPDQKVEAVEILCKQWGVDDVVARVLVKVIKNDRASLLEDILAQALNIEDVSIGRVHVFVETASQWDDGKKESFLKGLALGQTRVSWQLKPDLIGGVRVRIGDRVWDGSVRKQLNAIENLLTR